MNYRRLFFQVSLLVLAVFALSSCDEGETYARQKSREQDVINAFIAADEYITVGGETLCHVGKIDLISEAEFLAGDTVTRCELDDEGNYIRNEYVKFANGLIMQIVRRGAGEVLQKGSSAQVVARYFEYNMSQGTLTSRNTTNDYHRYADILDVTNTSGTISGSFNTSINGGGAMYRNYISTSVPEGWLIPLRYVRLGHQTSAEEGIAKVRLIVPHSLGHSTATTNVHAYFYEITFQETH